MCGLVAILSYTSAAPPVDHCELLAIRDAMAARGPDGAGLWISPDKRVGLGHRRLSLLDLSEAGAQPMASVDGALQIVFNGEIYNFRELRQRLEHKGFVFRSESDTEVLLQLYADKGTEMLRDLRGMYAFVIWDKRNRQIFAARDPLGIKPLYYADDGRTLRIASQVKALLSAGTIDTTRDPAGQAGFLLWGSVPEPFTSYRAISVLPAGAYLVAEDGSRPSVHYFCRIEAELAAATGGAGAVLSPPATRERLRAALVDSVRRHMVADVPVGVFLSAGLDSTVMTALASESPEARLRTITLGFEEYRGTANDETILASAVAHQFGTEHVTCWLKRSEFASDLEHVIAAMDQPSIDGVNTYFVAKVAHQAGLKAALSGIGGDEFFGGYPSFTQVPRLARLPGGGRLGKLGRAMRAAWPPLLDRIVSPKYAGLLEYCGTWGGAYMLRRALFMPWEIERILDPKVARAGWERLLTGLRLEETVNGIDSPSLKVTALESIWYMRNQLLRDSDWAGMAHSLEIRTPIADLEVMRAVARISARSGLKPRKGDLPDLPSVPLPPGVVERSKTGFSVPVHEWVEHMDGNAGERGLRGWVRHLAARFGFELSGSGRPSSPSPVL
jgi:asparagine synthase (glutamine-hydrolysing)